MNARTFCFALLALAPLAVGVAACSGASQGNDLTDSPTDTDSSELKICAAADCGPALDSPTLLCSDGSTGGNTGRCIKTKGTSCHWEMRTCPEPTPTPKPGPTTTAPAPVPPFPPKLDCSAAGACKGPAPAIASQLCWDGSTAGPSCVDTGGTCGWKITTCPPVPPELECGANICKKGQTCCSGMPLPAPTCVDGMACPVSQRQHKKDISYLSETDRQRLNDELMGFRLATYRYKSEAPSEREHLGFIIDDVAPSPAVLPNGERVDMYGYQTMSVAALQTQATELGKLRRELDELKATCAKKPGAR
jgi:hypothetical protein